MKATVLFIMLIISQLAMAQTSSIIITPERPVDCLITSHPLVNWVYKIQKMDETEQEVKYQFITQYGSCHLNQVNPTAVNNRFASVFVMQTKNLWPWQKEGVKTKTSQFSATELLVEVTFDKTVLFKKSDSNNLMMSYQPGVNYGPMYASHGANGYVRYYQGQLVFRWNIELSLDQNRETKMSIK